MSFHPTGKRTTTSTEGKQLTFHYTGEYYLPDTDKKHFFKERGWFETHPFIVSTTTVHYDCGEIYSTRFGIPCRERYNNGLVGYQNFHGFKTLAEAQEEYKLRKRLTTKIGIYAYCDVFLIDLEN